MVAMFSGVAWLFTAVAITSVHFFTADFKCPRRDLDSVAA